MLQLSASFPKVKDKNMPLYEITLEQTLFGQQIVNRWNYQSGVIPAGNSGSFLALVGMGFAPMGEIEAFGPSTAAGQLQNLQSTAVTFVQAIAKNLYSNTDFYTYAFPPATTGLNGGSNPMSPVVAAGFATNRTRSDIRRGQKRFAGITEADLGNGGEFVDVFKTGWQNLGDTMADVNIVPVDSSPVSFTPFVFGREKYHPEGKTTWAYKYYPTEAEQLEHIAAITAWNFKTFMRTQNTRQYGRGS